MSGGHFDYKQFQLEDIATRIDELVASNDNDDIDRFGDVIGRHYGPQTIKKFKETVHWLRRAAEMAQRVDWLVSGDDGEESFQKLWKEKVRPAKQPVLKV